MFYPRKQIFKVQFSSECKVGVFANCSKNRALKSHALSVRLTQTNSILRSHAETIISHAFEIPCSFSEVPS